MTDSSGTDGISLVVSGSFPCGSLGIKTLITQADPDIDVVVCSLPEVTGVVERTEPALVLIDVDGELERVTTCLESLTRARPGLPHALLVGSHDQEAVVDLLRSSPRGFLSKALDGIEIASSVRLMVGGHLVFGEEVLPYLKRKGSSGASEPHLEPEEKQLLRCLVAGMDNSRIGTELFMSRAAVKRSMQAILAKLGVNNRVQAAVWAARYEIV